MGELTMRSCNREVRPFFCFSAVLPYNVMPMRMLSLHTRFCFLLQRSCFAWFAFWWANRLKWQVCFIFFFHRQIVNFCEMVRNEGSPPSVLALLWFRLIHWDLSHLGLTCHLIYGCDWRSTKKMDCCYVQRSKLRKEKKKAKMLWVTGEQVL